MDIFIKGNEMKRKVTVGATDANTGQYVRFNSSIPFKDFVVATRASASIPGFFPAVELYNHTLIDGGMSHGLEIDDMIKQCQALGFS